MEQIGELKKDVLAVLSKGNGYGDPQSLMLTRRQKAGSE